MWGKRSSAPQGSERLAARRRLKRRRARIALGVLILLLCGGVVYGLQQSAVRISDIRVFGPPSLGSFGGASADQSFARIARAAMRGSYLGLVPRDSIFFFPASRIRADLITAHPDIAAVSIFRSGLTSLSIKVDNRFPVARWCGSTYSPPTASSTKPLEDCYLFDAGGFIYATTSVAQPINSFIVYVSLGAGVENPLGETLPNAEKLPTTFDLARQFATLGSPVTSLVFREDEVDVYLKSGTRVTYLLGDEQNAFTVLTSARANFDLTDGSVLYLDLRFSGKIYLKRK